MDTTYFKRSFGIMVLYDEFTQQALSVEAVNYETNQLYMAAVNQLQEKGTVIQSITCDGRKGLLDLFPDIPIQLCHFHQVSAVNRYLTRKPKMLAAIELRKLVLTLKNSDRATFTNALNDWYESHKTFLNERSINPETGKSHYTHKWLRTAYHSLKRNLPWLFTFEDYPHLNIPKTTNALENRFGDMKRKIGCHQGMRKENKIRFIKDYFYKQ